MKNTILIIIATLTWSCQSPSGERAMTGNAAETTAISGEFISYTTDIQNSHIEWIGARPASQHNGTVGLKEGTLKIQNGEITGGGFLIDLENIVVLDITDPGRNTRLREHLESDDFFDVPNHPTALFEITGVRTLENPDSEKTHHITGNLTMRGVTRSVTFNANIGVTDEKVSAVSEQFVIDRTEWGVNFQSRTVYANLVDRFILDEIALVIHLAALK